MAAPLSFRGELTIYRRTLEADNRGHYQLSLALQVLDNWAVHGDVETLWGKLQQHIPPQLMLTPEEFIYWVLEQRFLAEKLQTIIDKTPDFEGRVNARAKRHRQKRGYSAIAHENKLLDDVITLRPKILGRERTAPRIKFMRGWSEKFQELCGKPLDDVVRVLTEVAFGVAVSANAVRKARIRPDRPTDPPK